ncbi:MAG TPA: DsrE family protein [Steroidobacteraceae bacterium]|nr:DsrE family protein [Steroidobacteraceae bacterium]
MRHSVAPIILAALFAAPAAPAADEPPGFWTTPAIEGYGKIHPLPKGAYRPDSGQTYRIVFGMTAAAKSPEEVNPALERVARTVNLYASAGVPVSHLKFVAVAYGQATALALNDAQYKAAYGVANPNLPVIARLRKAGVDVAVCGQAVAEHNYQYEWVDPSVTLALAALTTITTLEHQGYNFVPL